jgi:iron complex outermembrane receptor protein
MPKFCFPSVVIAVLLISSSLLSQNKGVITGTVTDLTSGEPLVGVNLLVLGSTTGFTTTFDGTFEHSLIPGTYTIRAGYVGYEAVEKKVTINAGETATVDFQLKASPLQIGEELVVLGSRTTRSVIGSPVPIDIITSDEIQQTGLTQMDQVLTFLAPSFNASPQTISDGTDHVNPASVRGLGPDQVLVLVNGKRRHTSALVNVNGTFGRGTVGTDLNSIPVSAVEKIELLRDGASSIYGSDAIAGVINIVLKKSTRLYTELQGGTTGEGDGEQVKASINYGADISETGYFVVTGEYLNRERTDRSDTWTGDIFLGIDGEAATNAELQRRGLTRDDFTMKTGQSKGNRGMAWYNTGIPLGQDFELYSFGGLSFRNGEATGFFRLPNSEGRVVPEIYPNGFLPQIHTAIDDISFVGGLRGNIDGWDFDFSVDYGSNSFLFNIENTNNASMGIASPVSFDAGTLGFTQTVGNLDIVKLIDTKGSLKSLSLVLGAEYRVQNYSIVAGEDASWQLGNGGDVPGVDFDTTSSGAPKDPGSQVFAGFQPTNEVDRLRNNISVYAGLETEFSDNFLVDIGGRFENYSDFGSTVNGKIATRVGFGKKFALRGAASTGFRAPSLNQLWFNNVSIQFLIDPVTGELEPSRVLTSNNKSTVTSAFGVPDLKEETSLNFSAGLIATPLTGLIISLDYYYIKIEDRIVLTSRFTDGDSVVAEILAPFASQGVGAAQFFANAVDTETQGVELVASYNMRAGEGLLRFTLSGYFGSTEVTAVNSPSSILEGFEETIFNREERNRLEDAVPQQKGIFGVTYRLNRFDVTGRVNYFGKIYYKPTNEDNDEVFGAKTLLDLDVGFVVVPGLRLSVGGNNILNTFPDKHQKDTNISNGRFVYSRRVTQYGMNGGFYYARVSLNL